VVDEQSAAEATFSIMTALLAGNNLTHDVGYIEQGLTTSPEMILFSAEMISELRRFMAGISFDEESMAMETIHQVGSNHDYLATDHTLKNFRVLWQPKRFTRLRYDAWLKKGGKTMGQRLREQTIALMDSHVPQPLPTGVQQEIDYILGAG
jgi:trimethylamine--corrinoid protein Co-methyltransferase